MSEVYKQDDLAARLAVLERRAERLEAVGKRPIHNIFTSTPAATTSTVYVDMGPTLLNVKPGSLGAFLVGVDAGGSSPPGTTLFVSYRVVEVATGITVVASSDLTAWAVDGAGVAFTRFSLTPSLNAVAHDIVMTIRSTDGTSVGVQWHGLIVEPI